MEVRIGPRCFLLYSYDTLVGANIGGTCKRVANTWGPTTGKHINTDMRIQHYEVVDANTLSEFVNTGLATYFQDQLRERFL